MEEWLLELVLNFGYCGIFIATIIESTFVPIPAEVTVIPAGMLAAKGQLNYWGVLLSATSGVVVGSIINYWIGINLGRAFILRYGNYIFIKTEHIKKTELFFIHYGKLSVFLGRVLPGVKHYIAFVAGIARMNFQSFTICTLFGGLIWVWILLQIGFMTQRSNANINKFEIILIAVAFVTVIALFIKKRFMRD